MLTPIGQKGNWLEQAGRFKQKLTRLTSGNLLSAMDKNGKTLSKPDMKQTQASEQLREIMARRYFFLKNL